MDLALGGPGADRHPRNQVGDVLGNLRVEELGGGRQTHLVHVEEQLPGEPQTLVDAEAPVQIRVVDEPFPADGGSRLLEIAAHHHQEVIGVAVGKTPEPLRVLERRFRVVDGTRTGNNDETRITALQRAGNRCPRIRNDVRRSIGDWNFFEQNRGRNERANPRDAEVIGRLKHPGYRFFFGFLFSFFIEVPLLTRRSFRPGTPRPVRRSLGGDRGVHDCRRNLFYPAR